MSLHFRRDTVPQRVYEQEALTMMQAQAADVGQQGISTRKAFEQGRTKLYEQPAQRVPQEWVHRAKSHSSTGL